MPGYRCKILHVDGAFNVRDVGGYRGSGSALAFGRFLRAGTLFGLTDAGRAHLLDAGVDCIIDLRSVYERSQKPGQLGEEHGVADIHIPMLDYIQSLSPQEAHWIPESLEAMYADTLKSGGADFLRVFEVFASDYKCILFHCTAGKDRTGMAAMLLMGMAGVSEEDIIEDYSYSHKLNNQFKYPGFPDYLFYSKPETMRTTLDMLRDEFGGIPGYLAQIGVTPDMRAKILTKLKVSN